MEQERTPSPLTGIMVLELGGELADYCGKLLADLGAEVIKIEPPAGAPLRHRGPFAGGAPDPEKSVAFLYFNENKSSITLDLSQEAGQATLRELIASADVVVDALPPGFLAGLMLDYAAVRAANPELIMVSVTGFGQWGPHRDYKAPDIVTFAMSGLMAHLGSVPRPPLALPRDLATHFASAHVAAGILNALYHRQRTGQGQFLEVCAQEVLAQAGSPSVSYSAVREVREREQEKEDTGTDAIAAKDGTLVIGFVTMSRRNWDDFVAWIGNPPELQDPAWADRNYRSNHGAQLRAVVEAYTRSRPKQEVFVDGQRHALIMAPHNTPAEFLADPHINARGFVRQAQHPIIGDYRTLGAPFRLSVSPSRVQRPAPLLGEHNSSLLAATRSRSVQAAPAASASPTAGPHQLLGHLRVLDFTRGIAGPYVARFLGEYGAQVIKVESDVQRQQRGTRPGAERRAAKAQQAGFAENNRNKLSVSLNMRTEEGRRLARELARKCDVLVDNSSPRVLPSWGLDYKSLRAINPGIIVATLPSFGQAGPYRDFLGAVHIFQAFVGLTHLWNYAGETKAPPSGSLFADYNGGIHGVTAVMAALLHRERTGQGQAVDVAEVEALASLLGPTYLDILINGAKPEPQGNARDDVAPYGCYRCRGEDKWCVVAVTSEKEWRAFCNALGNPEWTHDPRFSSAGGRKENQAELERHVEEWTTQRTPYQVMGLLQDEGVPAAAVQNGEDLYRDPHLRARNFFAVVEHPSFGPLEHPGPAVRFSETPAHFGPYSLMGEHNREVFCGVVGLSETEFERLVKEGVIA